MNQPSHIPFRHLSLLLLVLAGVLGAACGDEEPVPGLLVFDRNAFDFGVVHVGETSAEQVFTVRNAGPERVDDLAVRLEPADIFHLVGTTCVGWLEPSETCTITIEFAPARAGEVQTGLTVEAGDDSAQAELEGAGAVIVRVTNIAASGAAVVSEPAGIFCGVVCEATFTVPEIELSAPGGFATWSGPCETMNGGACRLELLEDTSVELVDHAAGLQWIFEGGSAVRLAIDPENNIIGAGAGTPLLFKLSPAGEVLWQTDDFGAAVVMAVDAQGNIGAANDASVTALDGAGAAQWSADLTSVDVVTEVRGIGFDADGNLYLASTKRSSTDTFNSVEVTKLGRSGNSLWTRTYAPAAMNEVLALVVDRDGSVIISGFGHTDDFGSVQFLRKYDADGNVLWTNDSITFIGYELAVDPAGNIFVAQRIGGGEPGSYDLQKYSPDGDPLWGTSGDDLGGSVSGLAVTADGGVIAVGTIHAGESGGVGVWAAKFDGADGTRRRPIRIRRQGVRQYGRDVAIDGNGDVLISGGEDEPWLRKYDGAVFDQPAE